MKKICLIIFIISCNLVNAQYKIQNLPTKEEDRFPLVSTSDKVIEENINLYLHSKFLEKVYQSTKNPLEGIIKDDGNRRAYFHEYEVNKNTIPVLSLSILSEYCGAYCEESYEYSNFDLNNGSIITINDLIDHNKAETLTKILNNKIRKEINDFILNIPKNNQIDKEDIQFYTDQREIYNECLNNINLYKINDNGFDFYLSNDSIYLQRGRCSNHAMRALDELGNFTIGFSKTEIAPYLSEYGKNLYRNLPRKMTDIKEKIFTGTIGKYPIKGIITNYNSGYYWYERTKKLIDIDFTNEDGKIIIKENNKDYNNIATFILKQKDHQLIGTWSKINSNESLPVEINFNL